MQLSLFSNLNALNQEGFSIRKTFEPSNKDMFKQLESTWTVTTTCTKK